MNYEDQKTHDSDCVNGYSRRNDGRLLQLKQQHSGQRFSSSASGNADNGGASSIGNGEAVNLTVWGSQEDQEMLKKMCDEFAAANPDFYVLPWYKKILVKTADFFAAIGKGIAHCFR